MHNANTWNKATRQVRPIALGAISVVLFSLALPLTACSDMETDAEGRRLPSDDQVVDDVMPKDRENVVAVETTAGKSGEAYLHKTELEWYFDRGVTVKRKAAIQGAPDAVVVIGGLARYVWTGDGYEYLKFLTTYNEYENIPAPSKEELVEYVQENLRSVFVSRDHTIVDIRKVVADEQPWQWHTALSFTAPFRIRYEYIKNNTTTEDREDVFDIRFYRDDVSGPVRSLMASEKSREILGERKHDAEAIQRMRTLQTGLR